MTEPTENASATVTQTAKKAIKPQVSSTGSNSIASIIEKALKTTLSNEHYAELVTYIKSDGTMTQKTLMAVLEDFGTRIQKELGDNEGKALQLKLRSSIEYLLTSAPDDEFIGGWALLRKWAFHNKKGGAHETNLFKYKSLLLTPTNQRQINRYYQLLDLVYNTADLTVKHDAELIIRVIGSYTNNPVIMQRLYSIYGIPT